MSQPEDVAPLYFDLFTEVAIIGHLSQNRLARVLPDGLSIAQFGVLNHFARLGGEWAPARLARAFQVTKGAMTNTLQRLEAQKLISIKPDPRDARAKLVEVTALGLKVREKAIRSTAGLLDDVIATLPAQDMRVVLPLMKRLRATLDQNR